MTTRISRQLLAPGLISVALLALAVWWFAPGQRQTRRNAILLQAVRAGNLPATIAALDTGAEVNARDAHGITVLMQAARGERPDIGDPTPTDHPAVCELLIQRGAEVNAKTDSGFPALFWAARYGHFRVAKVLIDHGAEVNARDRDGMTALKWAAANRQTKVVELLKQSGARE